jgi:hypothetical protein
LKKYQLVFETCGKQKYKAKLQRRYQVSFQKYQIKDIFISETKPTKEEAYNNLVGQTSEYFEEIIDFFKSMKGKIGG